jgi:anthranilate synthase
MVMTYTISTDRHFLRYTTAGGIVATRRTEPVDTETALEALISELDEARGALLSSGYEYPGRYTRWDLGFVDPPLVFTAQQRTFCVEALNPRGLVLLPVIEAALAGCSAISALRRTCATLLTGEVRTAGRRFPEEERSKQPSVFSVVRALVDLFGSDEDVHLGLYGAFGYDLCFQFDEAELVHPRPSGQRDLVLYLPDRLLIIDRQRTVAFRAEYDFEAAGASTVPLQRVGRREPYVPAAPGAKAGCDHGPAEYASKVRRAKEAFKRGDLFELVLSQTFSSPCARPPSAIFRYLREHNPAPYAFLLNLGQSEYLVGASPEMYVRVEGRRVETCPISGTIERGADPIQDADRIRQLLTSKKDESELTMCTDVDRNDKSRICEPGSVRVLGRRQIELYSRVIHTVDHVEGVLRPEFDALDAFLSHAWAVTVTGAPKLAAIQRVEREEKSPRLWYGGAIGVIGFDGRLNTGLTLRTVRLSDGVAEVRAGATLLYDSDPESEERETRLKASAFLEAVSRSPKLSRSVARKFKGGRGRKVLLVDHRDSFVHTLANYVRQLGALVTTVRAGFDEALLDELRPDLVLLSPGPGTPRDFDLSGTLTRVLDRGLPVFGVCLGLQGIVEHFGGHLGVLDYPVHGKGSTIEVRRRNGLFSGLPRSFVAGRYHSLFALPETLPRCLEVTAATSDGVVMGIEHRELPVAAVQFHPESILSLNGNVGLQLLDNALRQLRAIPALRLVAHQ